MNIALRKARSALHRAKVVFSGAPMQQPKCQLYTSMHSNVDAPTHLSEAVGWLCRAQDHGSDKGVSYGCIFGEEFLESYPETTGYIIPTFLHLAHHYRDERYIRLAEQMGAWEAAIQMPCGAAGMLGGSLKPAIFDTGMVLLGWAALYQEVGSPLFRQAADRAARWMVSLQNSDGGWTQGNDHGFADPQTTTYNVGPSGNVVG